MLKKIIPENKEHWLKLRGPNINSTESPALLNCSPYLTAFELHHRHASNVVAEFDPNERTIWGTRLQDPIAHGIAADEGWTIRPMTEYIFDDELKIGSSFDFAITENGVDVGILEIKNVDAMMFREGWLIDEDKNIEAPPGIEIQVQQQLMLSGLSFAYIGALVGGNTVKLIKRLPDQEIHAAIKQKVAEFWQSIDAETPPEPDFARDSGFIASLFSHAEPGSVIDADDEICSLAGLYREGMDLEKRGLAMKKEAKAKILERITTAEKVVGGNFSISAGVIGPAYIEAHTREGYRNFRINWRKER